MFTFSIFLIVFLLVALRAADAASGGRNLCPQCGAGLKVSQRNWTYCPNKYNEKRPCGFKGFHGSFGKKSIPTGEIEPLENPSGEQGHIFEIGEQLSSLGNMMIRALAGTGKTTVLVQLIRVFSRQALSCLAIAFATRDKNALEAKAKGKAIIKTSNGAGHAILGDYMRGFGAKVRVDNDIVCQRLEMALKADGMYEAVKDSEKYPKCKLAGDSFSAIRQLVEKVRTCIPLSASGKSQPTDDDLNHLIGQFGIEFNEKDNALVFHYVYLLFQELASLKNAIVWGVDYTGQIFLPVYHGLKSTIQYDRVLVDEVQDQSYYTRKIAFAFLKPTGRMVAVGDENQGIYEWRGASEFAVPEMEQEQAAFSGVKSISLPLTICRRCSRAVAALAAMIVPGLRPLPDAPEGEYEQLSPEAMIERLRTERKGLVLCRINAPLISLALSLLGQGIRAVCASSKNLVRDLISLIDKCSGGSDVASAAEVTFALEAWLADTLGKAAKRRDGAKRAQIATDKRNCILALFESETVQNAGDLKRKIDELFPENYQTLDCIICSTIHGAKGGEAETVYIFSPKSDKGDTSVFDAVWGSERERDNTLYIAITRAMLRIFFVGPMPTLARFSDATASPASEEITAETESPAVPACKPLRKSRKRV